MYAYEDTHVYKCVLVRRGRRGALHTNTTAMMGRIRLLLSEQRFTR
jgi:hypothetical protein